MDTSATLTSNTDAMDTSEMDTSTTLTAIDPFAIDRTIETNEGRHIDNNNHHIDIKNCVALNQMLEFTVEGVNMVTAHACCTTPLHFIVSQMLHAAKRKWPAGPGEYSCSQFSCPVPELRPCEGVLEVAPLLQYQLDHAWHVHSSGIDSRR